MFHDRNPPKETIFSEFPILSNVVTVSKCWYYLSLLERFVDATKDMSEDVLKLYLVRAEYRYFQWIDKNSGNRNIPPSVPPIDIAFFWQAHMISPVSYSKDCKRSPPFFVLEKIPLQEIHDTRFTASDSPIMAEWKRVMKEEPYDLAKAIAKDEIGGCAKVRCIVCLNPLEIPWKEYSEWRADHSIALQCHCCFALFTVPHVGKANLLKDSELDHSNMSALSLDEAGRYIPSARRKQDTTFDPKLFVFRLINAVQSTNLSTPYKGSSVDLIQAVERHYKFAIKAIKNINWNTPQEGIIKSIRQYGNFLAIIKENPGLTAIPTIEIDLAWRTHMAHHQNYRNFCLQEFGKMINYDHSISEDKLKHFVEETDLAWKIRNRKREEAEAELQGFLSPQQKVELSSLDAQYDTHESSQNLKTKLHSKVKSAFSALNKKQENPSINHTKPYPPNVTLPNASNGYRKVEIIFKGQYEEGRFKSTRSAADKKSSGRAESINSEKTIVAINDDEEDKNSAVYYDKENINFYKDIKEFIKINNSDSPINLEFAAFKASLYNELTSKHATCKSNTDYLNQWTTNIDDNTEEAKVIGSNRSDDPTTSKYTKVFVTSGSKAPVFTAQEERYLQGNPTLVCADTKKDGLPQNNSQAQRSNQHKDTVSYNDDFNWILINSAWQNSTNGGNQHDRHDSSSCPPNSNNQCDSTKASVSDYHHNSSTSDAHHDSSSYATHHNSSSYNAHHSSSYSSHHNSSYGTHHSSSYENHSSCGGGEDDY